jgi:hypothetical protein
MGHHNGHGHRPQLAIPGQVNLNVALHDNGMADQAMLQVQRGSQVELHLFGGLTKLQEIAGRIASGMVDGRMIDPIDDDIARISRVSVRLARAVLAECERVEGEAIPDPTV